MFVLLSRIEYQYAQYYNNDAYITRMSSFMWSSGLEGVTDLKVHHLNAYQNTDVEQRSFEEQF